MSWSKHFRCLAEQAELVSLRGSDGPGGTEQLHSKTEMNNGITLVPIIYELVPFHRILTNLLCSFRTVRSHSYYVISGGNHATAHLLVLASLAPRHYMVIQTILQVVFEFHAKATVQIL